MRKKILLSMAVMLFCVGMTYAQKRELTGKVVDSTGAAVSGASINVKGENTGTSAGLDGFFKISVPESATLLVSGIGFAPQEVRIRNQESVIVTLTSSDRTMTEVVVTALGIKREKRSLSYSTQTIGSDQLNKTGTGNALNELNGKASGLTVISSTGDPGAGTYVLLRGQTSVTGNNQPLMVVDGVPIDNNSNNFDPQFNGFQAGGANADLLGSVQPSNRGVDLNPNDIESVTLLKGPAATALYGIQAASGAMVITTKRGAAGRKAAVTFNSSVNFDRHSQLPPLQTSFAQGNGDVYAGPATGQAFSWGPKIDTLSWDGTDANPWDKHGNIVGRSSANAKIPVTPYNTYDFFQTGLTLDNNIAVAGGTAENGFRMSAGNLSQSGIIPKSSYNKTNFAISGQLKASNKLSISGAINYIGSMNHKVQQGSNLSGIMLGLLRTTPTFDNANGLSDPAGDRDAYLFPNGRQRSYRGFGIYDNPYYTVNLNPFTSALNRAFGYGQATYALNNWITFNYRIGGDIYSQTDKNGFGNYSGAYSPAAHDDPAPGDAGGAFFLIKYANMQYNSDFTVNLKRTFGDLQASLLLGHNYFSLNTSNTLMKGIGLNIPNFFDISNAGTITNTQYDGKKRTQAFYGDLELNWRSMFYLSLTGRQEETSTLPPSSNVFFYPSASLGWVFTELDGLKDNNTLNFGKLRISAAQVGKDAPIYSINTLFSSPFTYTDGFVTNGVTLNSYGLSTNVTSVGNLNLKPEKTISYEGGVDLGFLNDRITFNGTVYYSKSSDIVIPAAISSTSGFPGKIFNAATMTNHGVELTLNTTPIKSSSGLKWDVSLNWSKNVNKVVSLISGLDRLLIAGFGAGEFEIDAVVGQPYGVIYGNTTPHSQLMNLKSPLLINDDPSDPNNVVGQPLGGGVGPNQVIGNPNPKWLGSVNTSLYFKGFTLGALLTVKHGGDIMNGTRGAIALRGLAGETANRGTTTIIPGLMGHLNADGKVVHFDTDGTTVVDGPGGANSTKTVLDQNYWQAVGNSVGGGQEFDVEDGSYTKLRQLSLTYDIPRSILTRIRFNALSLTLFANNLYVWTKYDGVDPETSLAGPSNAQGMDFFNNPGTKSYGIRLNVGL